MQNSDSADDMKIAIIGMAGRFPGASNVDLFWQNLKAGVESIHFFTDSELEASGVSTTLLHNPAYVKAGAVLENIDQFDASFFGYAPREAALIDPQQRLFLECTWEALEQAGYNPDVYQGRIGVYAGSSLNTYLLYNLCRIHELMDQEHFYTTVLANDKDFLATRVAYKCNLRGPAVTVQTACSTSLTAVHLACQSLLNGETDMAIAGGVTVRVPHKRGYLYQEAGILSPDGHCRAFDAAAQGTVIGNGVGIVVLKRLADALADHDHIYAVILGSAMNNDGASKVGYTAPSEDGQAAVIAEVLGVANIEPHTVSYIETHGTGTALGDQVEIAALTQIFGTDVKRKGSCAIGSVKTNIGHLDVAAGIAGLIKTALALKHRVIPPSLHFEQANPHIELANSPFYVNTHLTDWQAGPHPRRAGVSAFGVGGTNVHVVLEEPPVLPPARSEEHYQLLLLSAKTQDALERATVNLATYLKQHPDLALSDVAYTLQVGRKPFTHRRFLVCRDRRDAIAALETLDAKRLTTSASLRPPHQHEADDALLLSTLGKRWAAGMDVDWAHVQNPSKSARVPLPTYAFERQRYWIEPTESPPAPVNGEQKSETPVLGTLYPRSKMLHDCVPPRNQREATIAEMWQQLLGIESIGIYDNFFDLGGDSLLALQLINQLDNHFHIKVLRHHIAEAPTIDSLNQLLQTLSEQTSDNIEIHNTPLVLLKDGTRSPLFCIHPAGGTVLCYIDLARLLDADQPLYGLQAPGLYGGPNHESIEATASYYLDVVRSVQPQGPYYLGGLSYGGNVAFEMARQLHQQGAKVDLLALFDSHPLTAYAYPAPDRASFLTAFPWILSLYLERERELITYDEVQQHNPQEQLEYVFERAKADGLVPPGMDLAQLRQYFDVWNVHHHALRLYDPPHKCYPQPITLFRAAQEQPAELLALLNIQLNGSIPIAGWELLSTAPIQVYEIPGSHYTMLNKPHVEVLAQHLNTLLARNN